MVRMDAAMGNKNRYWVNLQVIVPAIPECQRFPMYRNVTDMGMTIKVMSKLEKARFAISRLVAALIVPHFQHMTYTPREFPTSAARKEIAYSDVIMILMFSVIASAGIIPWIVSAGKKSICR